MSEQFRRDLSAWLSDTHGMPNIVPTQAGAAAVLAAAKDEVKEDVRSGRVPADVRSFSELHDHVDANGYGGAFDWPCLPSEDRDEDYLTAFCDFWNGVQDAVHEWIASGAMLAEVESASQKG